MAVGMIHRAVHIEAIVAAAAAAVRKQDTDKVLLVVLFVEIRCYFC